MRRAWAGSRFGRPPLSGDGGFALIELLVTAALLSVVLLAILGLLDISANVAPRDQERGEVLSESQAGVYRMTRELRQAHQVVSADADTIVVNLLVSGASVQVTWDCGAPHPAEAGFRRCTRRVGTGAVEVVVDRVVNGSRAVFEYYAAPPPAVPVTPTSARYVRASVIVPARGDRKASEGHRHEIVFADGLYMRNRDA